MNDSSENIAPNETPSTTAPVAPADAGGVGADVTHRDSGMLRLIGWFFLTFGLLLFISLFWSQSGHGRIVNIGAGLVLVAAGAVGCHAARVIRRSRK